MAVVVKQGFDEISEGQKVMAQTQAGLKSTGGAAKVTAKDITTLASSISNLTGIDDEAVQAGENMLLTFTNIRNEVGKNNDIFNQATQAVADMATRMNDGAIPSGEQLSQTAIRVGKALNDPIKGMGALSRVGVQFDASQQKAIQTMVKAGDTMGAQKLILAELTKEFGGSAKAAGETLPGQLAKLRNSFDEVAAGVVETLLPYLTQFVDWANEHMPEIQTTIQSAVDGIVFALTKAIVPAVQAVIDAFRRIAEKAEEYWPRVQAAAKVVSDWFEEDLRPTIVSVSERIRSEWDQSGKDMQASSQRNFGGLPPIVRALMANVGSTINTALALLRGDWNEAWDQFKEIPVRTFKAILQTIEIAARNSYKVAKQLGRDIIRGLTEGLTGVTLAVMNKLAEIGSAIAGIARNAAVWAASIGAAIIQGIADGFGGLLDWLKEKLESGLRGLLSSLNPFSDVEHGGSKYIGEPIMTGAAKGVDKKKPELKKKIEEAVREAAQAVTAARGDFATAFSGLADVAMQAFDAKMAEWVPPAQLRLDKMQIQQQLRDLNAAITAAGGTIQAGFGALNLTDKIKTLNAEMLAATKAGQTELAAALRAKLEFLLAQQAQVQQAQHDKDVERERIQFKDRLERLRLALEGMTKSGGELTAKESAKFRKQLNDLLKDYGIDAKFWGSAIGISLAEGLRQAQGAVRKAALALAREIQKLLKVKSPTEEGPMSDLDKWWSNLVPTLISGVDVSQVRAFGRSLAGALGESAQVKSWSGSFKTFAKEATQALGNVGVAKDALSDNYTEFTDATKTMSDEAKKAFAGIDTTIGFVKATATRTFPSLTELIRDTNKDVASPLAGITAGLEKLAGGLNLVRAYLYGLRNAARDTLPEIWGLFRNHPVLPPSMFLSAAQTAPLSGAPVPAPLTAMGGSSVVNVNIYGPAVGTGRDFEDTVRRALYDVSRRNPGLGLATS